MNINRCLEEWGIGGRPVCAKGLEGDCRLREVFDECSLFHDRMAGDTAQLPWSHHFRLKSPPVGFIREEYLAAGTEELKVRNS